MRILGKILGGIVALLLLAVLVLSVVGLEPGYARPGLWIKGNVVSTPVTDWSFTDQYQVIDIETRTPYLIPHSVHATCVALNGKLYLASNYSGKTQWPGGRSWNAYVVRDPHIRLKIGNNIYNGVVSYIVTDPAEIAAVTVAKLKKYPPYGNYRDADKKPSPEARVVLLRVDSAGS